MRCSLFVLFLSTVVCRSIDDYYSIKAQGDSLMAKLMLTDVHIDVTPHAMKSTGPSPDCASQRSKSLARRASGDSIVYIPTCSQSNKTLYDAVQCHDTTKYCWCVNTVTGEPIPGSTSLIEQPRCIEEKPKPKKPKKSRQRCPAPKRHRFLRRLVSSLKTEMIMSGIAASSAIASTAVAGNGTDSKATRDAAILWKFHQLDKNKNKVIERSEWRVYKAILRQWKRQRRCSRSLFKSCDSDHNRKLTLQEWRLCLAPETNRVPAKRPEQLNPFLYILKSE